MKGDIEQAVQMIRQGEIVIFPTDTAFGIGCRIDDEKAVERLFALRKRPEAKAMPVLVAGLDMAQEYLQPISDTVKKELLDKYWPGALTVVLQSRIDKVPDLVRGGGDTLGVRMPNHPIALEIIKYVGVPILGSSANFAGGQTPYRFGDLDPELVKLVAYVVPGECTTKQASTVVDCTVEPWKVLRKGAVTLSFRAKPRNLIPPAF